MSSGPLTGITVVELAGIGPPPFAGMILADMGADVVRIDRPGPGVSPGDIANRGKRSIRVDLKRARGADVILRLVSRADVFIEGLRPGVVERLGVGPDECLSVNPSLVYGRVTGWGQEGPLAGAAGHDINYIALAGALAHMGRAGDKPTPALNMVADFGGGGMLLVAGVLAALIHAANTGEGQVVDAAMIDGTALQMTMIHDLQSRGMWSDERGDNLLDTGAPFYDTYETFDGRFMAIGALEPQFFAELVARLGWSMDDISPQMDRSSWPALRERLTDTFAAKTQAEWIELFEGADACVTPVLTMSEAVHHPHNRARATLVDADDRRMPTPAPRFGATPLGDPRPSPRAGDDTDQILSEAGFDGATISSLRDDKIVE